MGWFRWQGLEDYSKELKEQERYDQAFKLQEEASELKEKTYDLQLKTLEQTVDYQTNKNVVDALAELRKAGLISGTGTRTETKTGTGTGTGGSLKTNKEYFRAILQDYQDFEPMAAELLAKTNLHKDTGKTLHDFIRALETANIKNTGDYVLSTDQITDILNRLVIDEVELDFSGVQGLIDSLVGEAGDKVRKQLEDNNLFNKISTMVNIGTVNPKRPPIGPDKINSIKTNIFNNIESRIDYEKEMIGNTIASFEQKRKKDLPFTDAEKEIEAWMRKRNLQINNLGNIEKGNPNVYKFYGTDSFYEQQKQAFPQFKFPDKNPDVNLRQPDVPVFVPTLTMLEYLYKIGVIREGQLVRVPESQADSDGNTVFRTPAFNR